jgi:Tol biopolymer transport system component
MGHAGSGSLSPDGSLVTMMGHEVNGPGAIRFVANADGTELRQIAGRGSIPAGTWSPDGSRIVCRRSDAVGGIIVVDIATGDASPTLAEGNGAIWLDDHTLLIDV